MDPVKLSERWIKHETGKFLNVTKMSFNCHFGVTLSHLPVTRSSPNCVTRWRWPSKGQSWHLGTFETSKGGQVSSKRHNFIDEIFRQHFYLLKYQKLFSWEKNGSILEIFMVLKCISVWKIPGDWSTSTLKNSWPRRWLLFQGSWNSRQRSLCCIQWCWSHHYFRLFKNVN